MQCICFTLNYTCNMAMDLTISALIPSEKMARQSAGLSRINANTDETKLKVAQGRKPTGQDQESGSAKGGDTVELSEEGRQQVAELKKRDQEVRAHEAAHMAAGAGLVRGGATYSYQRGPDGQMYAIGGEVSLDASEVPDNPAATLQKAGQLRSAALAPASPSPQDRSVAAQANAMAAKAAAELAQQSMAQISPEKRLNISA